MRIREWVYLFDMTLLASELGQLGMRSLARRVLDSVIARTGDLPQRSEQVGILISCAQTAAGLALGRLSRSLLQSTVQAVRAIENPDKQVDALISVIRACFQLGDHETAHALMNRAIRQVRLVSERERQASALTTLASPLIEHGAEPQRAAALLRRARRLWRTTLPSPERRAFGLLRVAHWLREIGMRTLTVRTLRECAQAIPAIQYEPARSVLTKQVFAGLIELGHRRMAYALLRQTEDALASQAEGLPKRVFLLQECARALAEVGDKNQARRLFARARAAALQLDDTLWRIAELRNLARDMREFGLTASAEFTLHQALRQARQIANPSERASALYGIARALMEQKQFDKARVLLLEALARFREAEGTLDSPQRGSIVRSLTEISVETSDDTLLSLAVQVVQEAHDAKARLYALNNIISALIESGWASETPPAVLNQAYALIESLSNPNEKAWGYLRFARLMREARQRSQAKRAVQAALEQIQQVEPPSERAPLLAGVGACLALLGDKKQAEALIEQALTLIPEDPEDATLQQILTALEYEGETADPS